MNTKIIIIIALLFNSLIGLSQSQYTSLYNNTGQLRADTSLKITNEQLKLWRSIESLLIDKIVNELNYSVMATENNLKGEVLLSFDIDSSNKIIEFKTIKQVGGGLEECVKRCIKSFDYIKSLAPKTNRIFRYYIAIDFILIDADEYIKSKNAIPISKIRHVYIQHY